MTAILRATILGCGSSGGVPRVGGPDGAGDWGTCDPSNPKNRRTRCSMLVERSDADGAFPRDGITSLIIDTSPDFRAQVLAAEVQHLDGVLITHDHADQTHGLDDLRAFAIQQRQRIPVHFSRETADALLTRFGYCFEQPPGSWYPPILEEVPLPEAGTPLQIEGPSGPVPIIPFLQDHGAVRSHGFRVGDIAYSADVVDLPEESFAILEDLRVWVVDCLQMKPHGSHAHFEKTMAWIDRVKPKRAILTNLHVTMDYKAVSDLCPQGVEVAHDGMAVDVPLEGGS
ncbi:MAG: MBL fold metallo-hydrolase [Pseudomonadota bacterium]